MVRGVRWKYGLALVLLLHLFIHPVIHDDRLPELLTGTDSQHNLIREETDTPLDVCSLCRVAHALYAPAPLASAIVPLLQVGKQAAFAPQAPRTLDRSQHSTRAPPAIA